MTTSCNPGSMKSGPTLKPWTARPRRLNASNNPSVTVVLPTPLATPAITTRRGVFTDGHYQPQTAGATSSDVRLQRVESAFAYSVQESTIGNGPMRRENVVLPTDEYCLKRGS